MRNFNGNDKDMIGDMESTVLDSGEAFAVTENMKVDICEDTTFTTMTELIMDEHSNGIPCTDTAEY